MNKTQARKKWNTGVEEMLLKLNNLALTLIAKCCKYLNNRSDENGNYLFSAFSINSHIDYWILGYWDLLNCN